MFYSQLQLACSSLTCKCGAHFANAKVWPRPSARRALAWFILPSGSAGLSRPWRRSPGQPPALGRLRLLLFRRRCQTGAALARTRVDAGTQSAWTSQAGSAPTPLLPGEQLWLTSARAALLPADLRGGGGVHPGAAAERMWRGVGGDGAGPQARCFDKRL